LVRLPSVVYFFSSLEGFLLLCLLLRGGGGGGKSCATVFHALTCASQACSSRYGGDASALRAILPPGSLPLLSAVLPGSAASHKKNFLPHAPRTGRPSLLAPLAAA